MQETSQAHLLLPVILTLHGCLDPLNRNLETVEGDNNKYNYKTVLYGQFVVLGNQGLESRT